MTDDAPTRTPELDESQLTEAQRAVYDRIVAGPRGKVVGPLRVWLQSPDLADRAQALGQFARYDSALPPRLSELAILVTARLWSSGFEWAHHAPIGRKAGLSDAVVDAIGAGLRPAFAADDEAAVFDFAVELHRDRAVSDGVYQRALDVLGTRALVDLVGICGYYTLISMTINAFEVPIDHGPALPKVHLAPEQMFRTAAA